MWQRLQTLYFGIATLLVVSLFFSDVARAALPGGDVEHIRYVDKTVYLVWLIVLAVLQVLTLGGFKWRMRQMRVAIVTAVMCLGFQGFIVYDFIMMKDTYAFSWTALFPLVCCILDIFGVKNILLDEALVQSANRLRLPRTKKH